MRFLDDVLLFEVGGSADNLPAAEIEAARGGEHVLVLTTGEIIRGRLLNIEGGEEIGHAQRAPRGVVQALLGERAPRAHE